jgi:hypothetical protein
MNFSVKFWCSAPVAVVFVNLAGSGSASAQTFLMGAYQSTSTYFTEVLSTFQVPPQPDPNVTTVSTSVGLWPGLEDTDGTCVLQPVLAYGVRNTQVGPEWTMHNEVECPNTSIHQNYGSVSDGDYIESFVALDQFNQGPGPNCNMSTGEMCNFQIGWYDYSNDTGGNLTPDFTVPAGMHLTRAYGLIMELPPGNNGYSSCGNFPGGPLNSTVGLDAFDASGGPFTSVSPNFTTGVAGQAPFSDYTLNGQSAFNSCGMGISANGGSIQMVF